MAEAVVRPGVVYVVGAGPGDPDLLTVRARRVLEAATTVLYADSLVDPRLLGLCRPDATVRGTSGATLEPVVAEMVAAARRGEVVARVHSGDPSIFGAVTEQLARLEEAGVEWEVVPGVTTPLAAAAILGCPLTAPGVSQAVVFCRVAGRTPMPPGQDLRALARPGVSLCIFLSAAYVGEVVAALRAAGIADDTPAVLAERIAWPDQRLSLGVVGDLEARCRVLRVRRQALLLVGPAFALAPAAGAARTGRSRSALYDPAHAHVFRPAGDGGTTQGAGDAAALAVYALSRDGAAVARRLAAALGDTQLHLPRRLASTGDGAVPEDAPARAVVARLVAARHPLVLVMATGAAVRLVAPHLADKAHQPAVVAVDDAGRWVVPIAGAHLGGGNELARRVAAVLGADAVVTTASDGHGWPALDTLAARRGWLVETPRTLARVTTALLDGDPVGLVQEWGRPLEAEGDWPPSLRRYASVEELPRAAAAIVVSSRPLSDVPPTWVVLRPEVAVVGVGCETRATAAEVAAAVAGALAAAELSPACVRTLATIDRRREMPALAAVARAYRWHLRGFPASALARVAVPTPSPVVAAAVGTASVAEAAALLAAGDEAELLLPKVVRGRVTVAVARRRGEG